MSADNYLYVDRQRQRYAIVMRFASSQRGDKIASDEVVIADSTEASSAVLMANRLQYEHATEYGVEVSERVAKELGWR